MAVEAANVVGRYQLLEMIARGGMAEVFKAKSFGVEGFEKTVVIKRILPEFSGTRGFVDMFINEAKIAVNLSHANIVQVFDLGKDDSDRYYIAMEYVAGMDMAELLRRCLRRGQSYPIELAVYVTAEVCKGLDYAHRRRGPDLAPLNIVHRDISPHNVLVSFEGEVKITDFGIARAKHLVAEPTGSAVQGKFSYMSPEQARGEEVDGRTDVFSLGVVLYELVTGVNPFRDATGAKTLERVQRGQAIPICEVKADAPVELRRIIETSIAPDAAKRYLNAGRFHEDLIGFLYTSGLRVGAHDLAQFVQAMRDAPRPSNEDLARDIIQILDRPEGGTGEMAVARTGLDETTARQVPVEPRAEKTCTPSVVEASALEREQRDVTGLCIAFPSLDDSDRFANEARRIVERDGGRVVVDHAEYLFSLFGLEETDGRDLEAGTRCALRIRRVSRDVADQRGRRVGAALRAVRVVVDAEGRLQEDEGYRQLVLQMRDQAARCPGFVSTDARTARHLGEGFRCEDAAAVVAGAPSDWLVVTEERPVQVTAAPMVGRREAIKSVAEHLTAASGGAGRIVSLIGEAGIGKSRLLQEVAQRLRNRYEAFWYEARCSRQQAGVPYATLAALVRSIVGADETDPAPVVHDRLKRLRELGCGRDEVDAVASAVGLEVATAFGPQELARILKGAVTRIVSALAAERVTILVLEGAAWIDPDSIAAFDGLLHQVGRLRLLVFLTSRPDGAFPWRELAHYREISLGPLTEADAQRLVLARLDHPKDPPWQLMQDVTHKSGGNPLFIEEYLKGLEASGALERKDGTVVYKPEAAATEVPKTLRGIVTARIGQLGAEARSVLRVAAVIGLRFHVDLLAQIMGMRSAALYPYLAEFENHGVLARASLVEYAFVHDLTRDVIYDSLTYANRRELHLRVAQAVEGLYADRLPEFYEILAHHYRESADREKAITFLLKNGDRLAKEYSPEAALHQYLKAIDLMRNAPQPDNRSILAAYQRVGELALAAGRADLGFEKMRLAADLAEELGDRRALVVAVTLIGRLATKANRFGEALRHLTRALELSEGLTDQTLRRDILGAMGQTLARNAEHVQAEQYLSEAIELAVATGDETSEANLCLAIGHSQAARGARDLALGSLRRAEKIIQGKGDMFALAELHKDAGLIHFMLRDFDEAVATTEVALEIAKSYDFPYVRAVCAHNIGDVQVRRSNLAKAFTYFYSSLQICEQHGFEKLHSLNLMFVGYIDAVRLRSDAGIKQILDGLRFAEEKHYVWDMIQGKYLLGQALYELSRLGEAKKALEEAVRLARTTGNRVYVDECEELLSAIAAIELVTTGDSHTTSSNPPARRSSNPPPSS
jgi:tetratricopeptide (TPR) repeat protein/tRNA A-37 threonylcarbamoyl transferase component Bud32